MRFTVLGGNAPLLKRQNRAAVLRAIVGYGPISRRALRDTTGLTSSTITNIVAELIASGMVREVGVIEPTGGHSRAGRRAVEVVASPFGADMRVKGSLALALHDLLYAPTLTLHPASPDAAAS